MTADRVCCSYLRDWKGCSCGGLAGSSSSSTGRCTCMKEGYLGLQIPLFPGLICQLLFTVRCMHSYPAHACQAGVEKDGAAATAPCCVSSSAYPASVHQLALNTPGVPNIQRLRPDHERVAPIFCELYRRSCGLHGSLEWSFPARTLRWLPSLICCNYMVKRWWARYKGQPSPCQPSC